MKCRTVVLFLAFAASAVAASPMTPVAEVFAAIALKPYADHVAVVEIVGERGSPGPVEWIATLKDPTARGGVREITLTDGKITGERTPMSGRTEVAAMAPLAKGAVTTDAGGVFEITQREAVKNEVGFDWIDYQLKVDPQLGRPVWDVKIYDNLGAPVGTLRIAGDGGTVVKGFTPHPDRRVEPPQTNRSSDGLLERVGEFGENIATRTRDTTLRTIGNVQETVTGRRTIGPEAVQ